MNTVLLGVPQRVFPHSYHPVSQIFRLVSTFIPAINLGSFIVDWEARGLPETLKDVDAALQGGYDAWMFMFLPQGNLRRNLREAVKRAVKTLRTRRMPEQWLSDIVKNVYYSRLNQIDEEIENTLIGFVRTLDQVALDRQKDKSGIEAIHAGMNKLEKQLNDIEETIRYIKNRFT